MPIPAEYARREVFHFVHLDNLEGILKHGLLSNTEQARLGIAHRSVAIPSIQRTRAKMKVTCGREGCVHDYVPFYFCKRSPMLLSVVNARNVDQQFLVYLVAPISIVSDPHVVFSDASANRETEPPNFYSDPAELSKLNWGEIGSLKWSSASEDLKHQKMAELLVHKNVPWDTFTRIVVWNDGVANHIRELCKSMGVGVPAIDFDSHHYYTKYPSAPDQSLVTGPYWTKRRYEQSVRSVTEKIGRATSARFGGLAELRDGLRANLACLPETGDLCDLTTDNPLHAEDLGTHTRKVAGALLALEEFQELRPTDQLLTEIAAYLHDIGKGPKSRWPQGRYRDDRDHPVAALPMVERILTQEVRGMKMRSARVICKLICYHDLIGDIIGKGRREEQLHEIIDTERELDMLIALAKADVSVVQSGWWDQTEVAAIRERALAALTAEGDEDDE